MERPDLKAYEHGRELSTIIVRSKEDDDAREEVDENVEKERRDMKELKGFMDLGFDFSNPKAVSPRVRDIVPALKSVAVDNTNLLTNDLENGAVVKRHLKNWARFVALKATSNT